MPLVLSSLIGSMGVRGCGGGGSILILTLHSFLMSFSFYYALRTSVPAFTVVPVSGNWGIWNTWSTCSVTCGGGTQTRTRLCNNPAPANGGDSCVGDTNGDNRDSAIRACNTQSCCKYMDDNNTKPAAPSPVVSTCTTITQSLQHPVLW